jgi:hypothetical protein
VVVVVVMAGGSFGEKGRDRKSGYIVGRAYYYFLLRS